MKAEEERHEEETVEYRKKMKATKEHHQKWESTRDTRVGTWRDFVTKKKANKVCMRVLLTFHTDWTCPST